MRGASLREVQIGDLQPPTVFDLGGRVGSNRGPATTDSFRSLSLSKLRSKTRSEGFVPNWRPRSRMSPLPSPALSVLRPAVCFPPTADVCRRNRQVGEVP